MKPNRLTQAVQEIATNHQPNFEIVSEIDAKVAKEHYFLVGIRSSDTMDGFSKTYSAKNRCVHQNQWKKMQRQVSSGVFKTPFGDVYKKVVIVHNPTLPMDKGEKAKKETLSPTMKGKVKSLYLEGKDGDEIAVQLEQPPHLVAEYIADKL